MIVRRRNEMIVQDREKMRGGLGVVKQVNFLTPDEMSGSARIFGEFTLKPGDSIGMHEHIGESEFYLIQEGEGTYYMDDQEVKVFPGDLAVVADGHSHGIENSGKSELKFIALVLFTH